MKCEMSLADNFDCSPTVLTKKSNEPTELTLSLLAA